MLNKYKISIIIPVYNAEKYIKKCVESALNQTLKEVEVICINDGSPDNSIDILKSMQSVHENLVVIDKSNEGVWKARMDGIRVATGEYIGFLDSDDYLENDFAEKMYENIQKNNADIAICGFKRIDMITGNELSREMKYSSDRIIDINKNAEELISINTALWNKIYKTSILKQLESIDNPPRILEDMMFLSLIYQKINRISFVEEYLYNYMVINGSAMNTLKSNDIDSIKNAMLEVKQKYIGMNVPEKLHDIIDSMAFLHIGVSLMLSVYKNDHANFKERYHDVLKYLNTNFKRWRKTRYTKIIYTLTHGKYNLKIAIVRKVYVLHLFKLFLWTYSFVTKTLKIDIKW